MRLARDAADSEFNDRARMFEPLLEVSAHLKRKRSDQTLDQRAHDAGRRRAHILRWKLFCTDAALDHALEHMRELAPIFPSLSLDLGLHRLNQERMRHGPSSDGATRKRPNSRGEPLA